MGNPKLKINVSKLQHHDERKFWMRLSTVSPHWLERRYSPTRPDILEIHRLWNHQYNEYLLSKGRQTNTKKIRT